MPSPLSRRTVLVGGAAAAGLSLPGVRAFAGSTGHHPGHPSDSSRRGVGFTLDAEVLDGGEQVTGLTLDTSRLGPIDPRSLSTSTFTVRARATSPIDLAVGDQIFSEYDLERTVTGARLDRRGNVVLDLSYGEGQVGGGTLGYILSGGRNVLLDLDYTITQAESLSGRGGRPITIDRFRQGRLSDPEVDAFAYRRVRGGLKYRLYRPEDHGRGWRSSSRRRPLVVWLHGGGEGGLLSENYYDNESTLRANRGALGFATSEAQRIFGGAYVVAPQSTSYWIEDGDRFAPQILDVIKEVTRRYSIDTDRIYVVGCSNGGYMSLKMTVAYPSLFAASVPICGVVQPFRQATERLITDAELRAIRTPTWLVTSKDDDTVPPIENTVLASNLIPGARLSLYDTVTWNNYRYPGHWSWIYVGRNDPEIDGQTVWEWMAQQRRSRRR